MTKPVRIQRKRTKGWKMPPNCVYVGRPTKWGNPWFCVGDSVKIKDEKHNQVWLEGGGGVKAMLATYESHVRRRLSDKIGELRGKNLACFCKLTEPCHADVLLEIANQ